ncbi:hypothetical protein EJD97_007701 [Solanum chilense]|uniref:F-box domain-containing protein n=1 Tax=Solanum chilense TaxID=4083 RepID=A0A6N2BL03_SOLCI|nr:hypothetical protein EJD97_007701 [Solanum chilense]
MGDGQHSTSRVRLQHDPMECKIEKLPCELLVAILSYLSVKEAAKTCLVSRNWRYLWQYTSGHLEIYDRDRRTTDPDVHYKFVKFVNQVLKLHQGSTLDQLRIGFCFRGSNFTFDHWVKFAIQKEVKVFELDLAAGRQIFDGFRYYYFPDINTLSSGDKFYRFCSNLKSLRLVNMGVKDETIRYFLSNCPCLEQVCISFSKCLQSLRVPGLFPSLKSMEISWCNNVKGIEVNASNLESFTYIGPNILVPFQNVPQLSELTLGDYYCYNFIFKADEHTSYSSKLRKLKLILPPLAVGKSTITSTYPDNFPRLDNLRKLELDIKLRAGESLVFFTFFTKACPLLSRFTARIGYTFVSNETIATQCHHESSARLCTRFVHKHLKEVKLIGFTRGRSDYKLALHLLEIGRCSFNKIILQPTFYYYKGKSLALFHKQSKRLERKLPPGVELILIPSSS